MDFAAAPTPAELLADYRRNGCHIDASFPALMARNRHELGHLTAVIEADTTLTWRQLIDEAARFGGFLRAHEVGPGDVVVWQLPNWWESLVVAYGIWAAGAVSSPVVPIYREFELANVIGAVQPKAVVTMGDSHGRNHVEMFESASAAAGVTPEVKVVLRAEATGWTPFADAMRARPHLEADVDVDAPALVGWTSGTTSGAKGVVHSTRGFVSIPVRSARWQGWTWSQRTYMPAPIAHATGLLSAIANPIYSGCSAVLRNGWDAERAIDDIAELGVTMTAGAAVFMRETLDALLKRGRSELPLNGYPCGGSTIPTELAEACDDAGMHPARSWGMTECPSVTSSGPLLHPRSIRCGTDGLISPGCEIRLVDDSGADLDPGQIGEALVRGPQRTLGYLDPAHTAEAFDDDGWFRTGDLGILAADGSFTMTGRVKEIINRGGEKLSAREIEDALARHAAVEEVAVVAAPHDRLGEQPAAFVLTASPVEPEELASFLDGLGLAPQKIPRVWRFVDELPRTGSGKVVKGDLEASLTEPHH
jgi:acyl-CoA synthetase (AMP-forming)/AMP-acid ligase II